MRNIPRMLLILLCVFLSACAGLPQPARKEPGNTAFEERIATDTVNQIARLYPPARTQLNVVSTPDSFGALLAAKLRGRGFGVAETIEAKPKVLPFVFNDDFRMSRGRPGGSGKQIPRALHRDSSCAINSTCGLREPRGPRGSRPIPCRASR